VAQLERSLEIAQQADLEEHVARAYTNLAWVAGRAYQVDAADTYLDAGITYSAERDLDSWMVYMLGTRARMLLLRGKWNEADEIASSVLRRTPLSPVSRVNPLVVLGWIRARRGDSGAWRALDEALDVARPTGEVQRLGPVYAARAEAAWLDNDLESALQAARAGFELAEQHGRDTFILAELACWRRRLGARCRRLAPGVQRRRCCSARL
jgi:hypothetical protein